MSCDSAPSIELTVPATKDNSGKGKETGSKEKEALSNELVSLRQFFRYASTNDALLMAFGIFCALVNGAGLPLFSVFFGELIDSFGTSANLLDDVGKVALVFFLIGIVTALAGWAQISCWKYTALKQSMRIREEYLKAILRKDMTWFDTRKVTEISAQMDSDIKLIQEGMSEKFSNIFQFLTMFFVGIIVGFTLGWQLTLVIFSVVPLLALGGLLLVSFLSNSSTQGQKAYSKASAVASEVIHAMPTVASFTSELREISRYNRFIKEAENIGARKSILSGVMLGYTQFIMFCAYGLALWYGAKLIRDGTVNSATGERFSGGDVVAIFFSVIIGSFALGQAAPNVPAVVSGRAAAFRVYRIIDGEDSLQSNAASVDIESQADSASQQSMGKEEKQGGRRPELLKGTIELKNIEFAYPSRPDVKIFSDLSLKIEKGQTVALVGESGSGKSTIVGLLLRFYEPSSGNISLDGIELSEFDVSWLREQIGVVSQQPILFSGTIAENIRIGKPEATDEEVFAAAKLANAHEFIDDMPKKYNTLVSGSSQLSGGQKQRIAIARAIIRKPKILLLDEATAALDNQSEKVVQEALDNVIGNHTTLVIAHRLSTIRNADKICVFEKGNLVEEGTHAELMELNAVYKTLVDAQSLSLENDVAADSEHSEEGEFYGKGSAPVRNKKSPSREKKSNVNLEKHKSQGPGDDDSSTDYDEEEDLIKKEAPSVPLVLVLRLIRSQWWILFFGCVGACLNGLVFPAFSFVFSEMIELFYDPDLERMKRRSLAFMFGFFGIALGTWIINIVQSSCIGISGERLVYILRSNSFEKIIRQEISWFDMPANRPGILTTRLATDAEQVRALVVDRMGIIVQGVSMVVFGLSLGFVYGWRLTLVILGVGPFLALAGILQFKFMGATSAVKEAFEQANATASEAIAEIRTVKSFTREVGVSKKFSMLLSTAFQSEYRDAVVAGIGFGMFNFLLYSIYGLVFWLGAVFVNKAWMDFGDVFKVFFAIVTSFMTLGQISALAPDVKKASMAKNAIFALLSEKTKIDGMDEVIGKKEDVSGVDIELKDVRLTYPARSEVEVLKGLNLRIPAGKQLALVGASGSGKSSIISLLQRFYDYDGQIYFGETELRNLNVKDLRSQIAVVSQEPTLFTGTIRENIMYGNEHASEEELKQAMDQAAVTEFVSKLVDSGVDTLVGSKGIQLSGGQRQRVAIARAILKNPKILLLDEATSALDNQSEKIVQESLDKLMVGRTTIVIAHRLSTIRHADQIAVMDNGVLVEIGTHEELVLKNGIYANLVRIGEGKSL